MPTRFAFPGFLATLRATLFAAILVTAVLILGASCARSPRAGTGADASQGQPVVLIHGLGLSAASMKSIGDALHKDGYRVCAIDYPSRKHPIDTLVVRYIAPRIQRCFPRDTVPLDFVTHSMGGILVRALSRTAAAPRIGRVVMIAPPNRGSEVVDSMAGSWWFGGLLDAWGGAAGHELGTDSNSVPNRLTRAGPPAFTFGVIAATTSLDPLFSEWIAGRDDGKVGVENTKLEGMKDFVEIRSSHTMVLWRNETVRQVRAFLKNETFEHSSAE